MKEFYEAIERYEGYRSAAREVSLEALERRIDKDENFSRLRGVELWLGPIDEVAIDNWFKTHTEPKFPWDELRRRFRPYIDRFELAVWANGYLCGMAIGRPSRGPSNVTIHFGERWMSGQNPIAGLFSPIAADAAEAYAIILDRGAVKIKDPVAEAIPAYMRIGFKNAPNIGQVTYLERRIR